MFERRRVEFHHPGADHGRRRGRDNDHFDGGSIHVGHQSPATSTVTDIGAAVGYELVGFVVKGGYRAQGEATAVGGFGVVAVDADPFATTQVVGVPKPPLCCYGVPPWVPFDSPTLRICTTVFTVKEDEQVNITVSIPPRSGEGSDVECPTG